MQCRARVAAHFAEEGLAEAGVVADVELAACDGLIEALLCGGDGCEHCLVEVDGELGGKGQGVVAG